MPRIAKVCLARSFLWRLQFEVREDAFDQWGRHDGGNDLELARTRQAAMSAAASGVLSTIIEKPSWLVLDDVIRDRHGMQFEISSREAG